MQIGKLLGKLIPAPADSIVVVPSCDHSYRKAGVHITKAIYNKTYGHYSEYWEDISLASDEEIVNVVVID